MRNVIRHAGYPVDWLRLFPIFLRYFAIRLAARLVLSSGNPEVASQFQLDDVRITSGGGFSTYYPSPPWQNATTANYFNTLSTSPSSGYNPNGRGYPDVSLISVYYQVYIQGQLESLCGTSASAPVFATMITLTNAARAKLGQGPVGFLNPTLYASGSASNYFNDVTSGINNCVVNADIANPENTTCCESGFQSSAGWDPVTGFGSISFPNLLAINHPPSVSPSYIPSAAPSESERPTPEPTTIQPSMNPSPHPSVSPGEPTAPPSSAPSGLPSVQSSIAPSAPSLSPTCSPTANPVAPASVNLSALPTAVLTASPTFGRTTAPVINPTATPTDVPVPVPSAAPSFVLSCLPSAIPTIAPSMNASSNQEIVFTSNITFSGVTSTSLDASSQQCIKSATAVSMGPGVAGTYVTFVSS